MTEGHPQQRTSSTRRLCRGGAFPESRTLSGGLSTNKRCGCLTRAPATGSFKLPRLTSAHEQKTSFSVCAELRVEDAVVRGRQQRKTGKRLPHSSVGRERARASPSCCFCWSWSPKSIKTQKILQASEKHNRTHTRARSHACANTLSRS